jgi:hypothetical protein
MQYGIVWLPEPVDDASMHLLLRITPQGYLIYHSADFSYHIFAQLSWVMTIFSLDFMPLSYS